MSVFKRGNTWWYEFQLNGSRIRESARTGSKTIAREAERHVGADSSAPSIASRHQSDSGCSRSPRNSGWQAAPGLHPTHSKHIAPTCGP